MALFLNARFPADQIVSNTSFIYRVGRPFDAQYTDSYWVQAMELVGLSPVDSTVTDKQFDCLEGLTEQEARMSALGMLLLVDFLANSLWNADNP